MNDKDNQHEGAAGQSPPATADAFLKHMPYSSPRTPSPFSRLIKKVVDESKFNDPDYVRTNFGWMTKKRFDELTGDE